MIKKFVEEIFDEYGLAEDEIEVYEVYCRVPRATIGEVYLFFKYGKNKEIKYETVLTITEKLVDSGFLKEIEGIIKRYIPLEPFFELYSSQSESLRNNLTNIKEQVTEDKSKRFKTLEEIQNKNFALGTQRVSKLINTFILYFL
jgi:hypothetical protein